MGSPSKTRCQSSGLSFALWQHLEVQLRPGPVVMIVPSMQTGEAEGGGRGATCYPHFTDGELRPRETYLALHGKSVAKQGIASEPPAIPSSTQSTGPFFLSVPFVHFLVYLRVICTV